MLQLAMHSKRYTGEGVVLSSKDYGEADRIINILTRSYGKITFIAKGVRRPSSRKRGHLDNFNHIRFSASSGTGMDILTEAELVNNFSPVKENLEKVTVAYYFAEVVNRSTYDHEPHENIFMLLVNSLTALETRKGLKSLRHEFARSLLSDLGFWPRGKELLDPDAKIQEIIERKLGSLRVGKKLVS